MRYTALNIVTTDTPQAITGKKAFENSLAGGITPISTFANTNLAQFDGNQAFIDLKANGSPVGTVGSVKYPDRARFAYVGVYPSDGGSDIKLAITEEGNVGIFKEHNDVFIEILHAGNIADFIEASALKKSVIDNTQSSNEMRRGGVTS